jgi:hypothetical protein
MPHAGASAPRSAEEDAGGVLVLQAFAASLLVGVAWKMVRAAAAVSAHGRPARRAARPALTA